VHGAAGIVLLAPPDSGPANDALATIIGKAVQVVPIKPTLKAPGHKHLKPEYHKMLSTFAFKVNLRRFTLGAATRSRGFSSERATG
jgi:hypothetical protein